ncbi:MAG: FlgD immunoglobulin-like domain containing protein [Rhodothermales bacterium]
MKRSAFPRSQHFLVLALGVLFLTAPIRTAHANVYASQLAVSNPDGSTFDGNLGDGTGALLSFFLNDDATGVRVAIKEAASGTVVHEVDLGAQSRGRVETTWDGTGSQSGTAYVFEVTAEQNSYSDTEWTIFFDSGDIDIFTRGVDVVRNQNSPNFGLIFAPNTGGELGKGITIYNPDGSFHDPFLVAADVSSGGSIDWGGGSNSMFSGVLDDEDRFYVSAVTQGEVRRLNADFSVTPVVTGLTNPKGLWLTGTGAEKVLYIADDTRVVRAAIGSDDVFTGTPEVLAEFTEKFPRNIAVDDEGALYVSLRASNDTGSEPLALEKYDLSGTLPVTDGSAAWSFGPEVSYRVASIEIDPGTDRTSSADDRLYFATRAGSSSDADGIWRVNDLNDPFTGVTQVVSDVDLYNDISANINDRAAIKLDAAGNLILMENSNEHLFFLTPPGTGGLSTFSTTSLAFTVNRAVAIGEDELPDGYRLAQNYPNPFNPSTTVEYTIGRDGFTKVRVFNALGREVRTLVAAHQTSGTHQVTWNGDDESRRPLSSGVYLLVVESGRFRDTIQITLAK